MSVCFWHIFVGCRGFCFDFVLFHASPSHIGLHHCPSVSLFLFLYLFINVKFVREIRDEDNSAMFKDMLDPRSKWITLLFSLCHLSPYSTFRSYHLFTYTCACNLVKKGPRVGNISHHLDPTKLFFLSAVSQMDWLKACSGSEGT